MSIATLARWVVLGALFLIPFLPLYVDSSMFFPFITSKGFAFRILIGIAFGAWVLLALCEKKYRPRFSWVFALYGLFVLWMLIADLFAVNAHKALWSNYERMDGWVSLIHVFLFFVVAGAVFGADKLWKKWWLTMLAASALVAIHGLWQIFGLAEIHQGGMRVDANFGNAIYFAVYLMFMTGIALWQALAHKGWLRYLLLALAALQVFLIFMSATRGVILALFAAALLVSVVWAAGVGGKARVAAGTVIAVLLLAGFGFFLAKDSAFVQGDPTLARLSTVFESKELAVRMTLWGMAAQGFAERPVLGWGQEGFNYVFNKYYEPSLHAQEPWFDRAHNTYIDWLIAGGFPAGLLFIGLLLAALYAHYRADAPRAERLILAGILIAYMVQALAAFDNLFSYLLLAAVLAMAHDRSSRPWKLMEHPHALSASAAGTVALPVVLVITASAVWLTNAPSIAASQHLIRAASAQNPSVSITELAASRTQGSFATQEIAEQMITFASNIVAAQGVPTELKQQAFTLALNAITEEIAKAPDDARLHLIYAQGLRAAGQAEAFYAELAKALTLSPRKQSIYYQRGVEKWQAGDRAGASADFTAGYELYPSSEQGAAYAASGRIIAGDLAGGRALLMERFGTTSVSIDPLRFAFFEARMYPELIAALRQYVEREGGSVQSRFMLAQGYAASGDLAAARAEVQATIAANPSAANEGAALLQSFGTK